MFFISVFDIWLFNLGSLTDGVKVDAVAGRSGSTMKGDVGLPLAILGSWGAGEGAVLLGGAIIGTPVDAAHLISTWVLPDLYEHGCKVFSVAPSCLG